MEGSADKTMSQISCGKAPLGGFCWKVPERTGEEQFIPVIFPHHNEASSAQTGLASRITLPFPLLVAGTQISPEGRRRVFSSFCPNQKHYLSPYWATQWRDGHWREPPTVGSSRALCVLGCFYFTALFPWFFFFQILSEKNINNTLLEVKQRCPSSFTSLLNSFLASQI